MTACANAAMPAEGNDRLPNTAPNRGASASVVAGVAQRLACGVQRPLEDRIEGDDLVGGDGEAARVEHRRRSRARSRHDPTRCGRRCRPGPSHITSAGAISQRSGGTCVIRSSPATTRSHRASGDERTGQHACATDDRDRRRTQSLSTGVARRPVAARASAPASEYAAAEDDLDLVDLRAGEFVDEHPSADVETDQLDAHRLEVALPARA